MKPAFSFDGPAADKGNQTPDLPPREKKALLFALAAYGRKKSPSMRTQRAVARAERSGSDSRAVGAGLAVAGAVADDPYAFAGGLAINADGHNQATRAIAHAYGHSSRVTPADPATVRLLAERGGDLGRQPIWSRAARTRWLDTVSSVRVESDGSIHGRLVFRHLAATREVPLTFDSRLGLWTVDMEAEDARKG